MTLKSLAFPLSLLMAAATLTPAQAETWTVDADASTLGFKVTQGASDVTGVFKTWSAEIDFDTDAPAEALIRATIQPASAQTGNPQFDGTLAGKDWFDAAGFPEAVFKAESASLIEGNSYRASGTLTIKDSTQPVDVDFTLDIDGDTAHAVGTARLARLSYKIGTSVGADTVSDEVIVTLDLTARR